MKLRLSQLRRLVQEVALSPTVFQNNKPVSDPLDRQTLATAVQALEEPFRRAVEQNLVLASKGSYNSETREFDDAAYEHIQQLAQKSAEAMAARVHKAIMQTWQEAMQSVGGKQKKAA